MDKAIKYGRNLCSISLLLFSGLVFSKTPENCAGLIQYQDSNVNVQITSAQYFKDTTVKSGPWGSTQTLVPHCHVEGEIDKRLGVNDESYALRFAINLPNEWNGRFLFQGGGGLNGTVSEPVGDQVAGTKSALQRGFAVISTDSGHQAKYPFDSSFMADQEAALNFFLLGNMRVTTVTKPIVETYYQNNINKSYFVGCSTGGREGMIMAQRFPYLYDGIVSGAPAIRTGLSNLALRWMKVQMNQVSDKDEAGLPVAGSIFTKKEQKLIVNGLLESCDELDGVKDELIFNNAACQFKLNDIACDKDNTRSCVASTKIEALEKALAGPIDSRGFEIYSPFLLDTGIDDSGKGMIPGIITDGAGSPVPPSAAQMLKQDVDTEFAMATALDSAIGDTMSLKLSSFSRHGGKQIFYHGISDPWFSAADTLNYYKNMAQANGGKDQTTQFSRLFLMPGMGHCGGGEKTLDNVDMLTPIVNWVEKNQAPKQIIATGRSMPNVSRPLCPYPQYPHYNGSGDKDMAANFSCRN